MSTLMTAPNLLVRAGEILAAQGWCQDGAYEYKPGREIDEGPLDLAAALAKAAGVDLVSRAAGRPVGVHADAVMILARHVFGAEVDAIRYREPWGWLDQLTDWQDESARTVGQVIAAARGAAEAATGAEGPFYPQPGSPVPDRHGYLVAEGCPHAVAESEWRAGFRTCERCPSDEWAEEGDGEELPKLPDALRPGELYGGREDDLLFCITGEHGIGFVTNRGTWVPLDEAARVYAPLKLLRAVDGQDAVPDCPPLIVAAPTELGGGAE